MNRFGLVVRVMPDDHVLCSRRCGGIGAGGAGVALAGHNGISVLGWLKRVVIGKCSRSRQNRNQSDGRNRKNFHNNNSRFTGRIAWPMIDIRAEYSKVSRILEFEFKTYKRALLDGFGWLRNSDLPQLGAVLLAPASNRPIQIFGISCSSDGR